MQQRRVRLGDILDDYCPRERRVTNHVVLAMIEEQVKQTRCTTCDADHEYKAAKVPSSRRKKIVAPAEGAPGARPRAVAATVAVDDPVGSEPAVADTPTLPEAVPEALAAVEEPEPFVEPDPVADDDVVLEDERDERDEWPVHRPLIRATLPRPEGQTPERKATDFTMRPANGRFEPNRNNGPRNRGHRPVRQAQGQPPGPARFGGPRGPGPGQGPRQGAGQGPRPSGQGAANDQRGNRQGPGPGAGGGRPPGQSRGPRQGSGAGRKRGR